MSVHVVRAFARLRQLLVNHKALAAKLVAAIRQLAAPDGPGSPMGSGRRSLEGSRRGGSDSLARKRNCVADGKQTS